VKGTEVWLPVSDGHSVPRFPGITNLARRNIQAQPEIIELAESVLVVVARARLIAGLVGKMSNAMRPISGTDFDFIGAVIVGGDFAAPVSNEIVRGVPVFAEFSDNQKIVTSIAFPPVCQIVAADNGVMRLSGQLQRRSRQWRTNSFCLFVRPDMAWSKPAFEQQARFAEVRVISESGYCGALVLSENGAIILMNFHCPIAFVICRSLKATFARYLLCVEISGSLGLPFDDCNERSCWDKIPFVLEMDDRGNLGVILSDRSPKHDTQSMSAVPVVFLRAGLRARTDLQDKSILGKVNMGKWFQRKFEKLH
jgi:hypothetical protein